MSRVNVRPQELISGCEELSQLNSGFRLAIEELEQSEGRLNTMWDGEANDTFHNAFMSDKEQMKVFSQEIDKYVNVLRDIANRYTRAEAQNTDTAKTRTYR